MRISTGKTGIYLNINNGSMGFERYLPGRAWHLRHLNISLPGRYVEVAEPEVATEFSDEPFIVTHAMAKLLSHELGRSTALYPWVLDTLEQHLQQITIPESAVLESLDSYDYFQDSSPRPLSVGSAAYGYLARNLPTDLYTAEILFRKAADLSRKNLVRGHEGDRQTYHAMAEAYLCLASFRRQE